MNATAPQRGPSAPRRIRGLVLGGLIVAVTSSVIGCGVPYVFRDIAPLHVTGWSFPYPIFATQSQRLEEDLALEEYDRVPVFDRVVGEIEPPPCADPPTEAEVYRALPRFRHGVPFIYEVHRNNVQIVVEPYAQEVGTCKVYPLVGVCKLVTCIYKCTIYFDESYFSDFPIPFNHVDNRVEVIYIDKSYLERCAGPSTSLMGR